MMISKDKTYRTRDGREVRIYATDGAGEYCIHGSVKNEKGWEPETWTIDGVNVDRTCFNADNLVESDPHGILPRHRELLAAAIGEVFVTKADATDVRGSAFNEISPCYKAALIALAKLDNEKAKA